MAVWVMVLAPYHGFADEPSIDGTASQPSAWTRFWQGVGNDWRQIGKDIKESGVKVGKGAKSAFQQMPQDFKEGSIEAGHAISGGKPKPIEPRTDR